MWPAGIGGLKRCSWRWSILRDMLRETLVKPSELSVASNARSTSSLLTFRTRTPVLWPVIRQRRRKPSATAIFGRSHFSAAFRSRSCMTTPESQWPASWVTVSGNGRACSPLQSHYLFKDRFGRPGKGNDKGKVEGLVGYARRNYLVPIPMFESFEALNAHLLECCRRRMTDCLRGHGGTIGERLARDLAAFQTLPPAPYGWQLPEEFMILRRLLEARMGKQGKREFVQVLRLMEVFRADEVAAAVRNAIARGAIGFDAVKHLVLCHIERRPPRLDMTVYPYLPRAHVAMTSAKTYLGLLTGAAS